MQKNASEDDRLKTQNTQANKSVSWAEVVERWRGDRCAWIKTVLGVERIEPWQERALSAFVNSSRVAIRSANGVGKSTLLSWIILSELALYNDVKIACTAPTQSTLFDVLWSEVGKWERQMKPEFREMYRFDIKSDRIERGNAPAFAVARTARKEKPEALQGFHAERMIFIMDEASGIDEAVFEVGEGSMSTEGAKTIMVGNPTRSSGYFAEAFRRDANRWTTFRVSAFDSSRVSKEFIEGIRNKYGEESDVYRVRVLGEFPTGGGRSFVPMEWAESAINRQIEQAADAAVIWGLDVARFGDDRTVLTKRQGLRVMEKAQAWTGIDLMATAQRVIAEYNRTPRHLQPEDICVDAIGIGAGVVDILKHARLPVRGVNISERKAIRKDFYLLRDELWWRAREWFETRSVSIPADLDFVAELCSVDYKLDETSGKIKVDDKEAIGYSPDLADSFVLTFYPVKTTLGRAHQNTSYNAPAYGVMSTNYSQGRHHDSTLYPDYPFRTGPEPTQGVFYT